VTLKEIAEQLAQIQDRLPDRAWCPVCELHTGRDVQALAAPLAALQLEIERHLLAQGQL
jgi:hypothetical protein